MRCLGSSIPSLNAHCLLDRPPVFRKPIWIKSKVTICPYVWRSGGAPASHLTQDSKRPRALDLPAAVMTQGRWLHGG